MVSSAFNPSLRLAPSAKETGANEFFAEGNARPEHQDKSETNSIYLIQLTHKRQHVTPPYIWAGRADARRFLHDQTYADRCRSSRGSPGSIG